MKYELLEFEVKNFSQRQRKGNTSSLASTACNRDRRAVLTLVGNARYNASLIFEGIEVGRHAFQKIAFLSNKYQI